MLPAPGCVCPLVLSPLAVHPCILEWFYKPNNILSSACLRPFLLLYNTYNNTTYSVFLLTVHLYVTAKEAGGSFQTQYPGQTGRAGLGSGRQMIFSWSEQ